MRMFELSSEVMLPHPPAEVFPFLRTLGTARG